MNHLCGFRLAKERERALTLEAPMETIRLAYRSRRSADHPAVRPTDESAIFRLYYLRRLMV